MISCKQLVQDKNLVKKFGVSARHFGLTLFLSGSVLFDAYVPFGLGMIAASGSGGSGLAALLGAACGAALFLPFSAALRYLAAGILLYTANNAFYDTEFYKRRAVVPLFSVVLMLAVEFVYVLEAGTETLLHCLLCAALTGVSALCFRTVLHDTDVPEGQREGAALFLLAACLSVCASLRLEGGIAPGRAAAVLCVMLLAYREDLRRSLLAALCIGITMDFAAGEGNFFCAALYSVGALAMNFRRRGKRTTATILFCAACIALLLPLPAAFALPLLYEILAASLVFLLLPGKWIRKERTAKSASRLAREEGERSDLRRRLEQSAAAFRELYDSVSRFPEQEEENPSVIFDRSAEAVCASCSMRKICWDNEYEQTFQSFRTVTPLLLTRGRIKGDAFPSSFTDRCIRFSALLAAIHAETAAYLLRRQYRKRLSESRGQTVGQYAELSALLSEAAQRCSAVPIRERTLLSYRIGSAVRAKNGESISGDCTDYFETEEARLCLALSDGMGSGMAAHREASLALRLLEKFLRAGVGAAPTLRTLNNALALRGELSESFTTLDLLLVSLRSGEAELYKYGAAASYCKKNARVRKISVSCLPAGLQNSDASPEATLFRLEEDSYFVMVTDGVTGAEDDEWLQDLLAGWSGDDPQLLADSILKESLSRGGTEDDASALVLYVPRRSKGEIQEE